MPSETQTALFSTTMPLEILNLTKNFMTDPVKILVKNEELTLDSIKQYYIPIEKEEWKMELLLDLYGNLDMNQAIIFCNSKKRVIELTEIMKEKEFIVSAMHGDMDQIQRDMIMKEFRTGSIRVVITTDEFAREIDFQQLSLVINFELPLKKENYINRIGRAGRCPRRGTAINFVSPTDARFIKEI